MSRVYFFLLFPLLCFGAVAEDYIVERFYQSRLFRGAIELRVATASGERLSLYACLRGKCEGFSFRTIHPVDLRNYILRRGTHIYVKSKVVKSADRERHKAAVVLFPAKKIKGRVLDCRGKGRSVRAYIENRLANANGSEGNFRMEIRFTGKDKNICAELKDSDVEFFGSFKNQKRFEASSYKVKRAAPTPTPRPTSTPTPRPTVAEPKPDPIEIDLPKSPLATPTSDPRDVLKGLKVVFSPKGGVAVRQPPGCKLEAAIDVEMHGDLEPKLTIETEIKGLVGFPTLSKSDLLRDIRIIARAPVTEEIFFSVGNEEIDEDSNFGGKPRFSVVVDLMMHRRQNMSLIDIENSLKREKYELEYHLPKGVGCDNKRNEQFKDLLH